MFFSKFLGSRAVSGEGTAPSRSIAAIFGRKRAAGPASTAVSAGAIPGKPACDRFLDRTDKDKFAPETGERYCADKEVMIAALEAMPLDARGDIVASMALLAAPPDRSVR